MTAPPISIGLPVWNGEQYLPRALDSLLAQTFTDFELIVADNASTDSTPEICADYARRDARIRVHRHDENLGAAANFNFTFHRARAPHFTWATYDDERHPENLARCIEELQSSDASVVLAYPRAEFIDADSGVMFPDPDCLDTRRTSAAGRLAATLSRLSTGGAVCGLFRTDALAKTRLIGPFPASDLVLLAEISMLGEIHEIDEVLFSRRVHEGISRADGRTIEEVQQWFDPKRTHTTRLPKRLHLALEYQRSVERLPLSATDRMLCRMTVAPVFMARRARVTGGRLKHQARRALSRQGTST